MDPPYIHHARYVSVSSPTTNIFGPSSRVYSHENSNNNNYLPRPQQPLPPPPQQPLPLPPPPPPTHQQLHHHHPPLSVPPPSTRNPYNSHHHPQFNFDPNLNPNPKSHNLDHILHHHQRSHDFAHRVPVDDDRLQHHRQRLLAEFGNAADAWNSPRTVPDHRPVVNNLEHHHQFDNRPASPYRSIEKIKHELDMSHRFRERQNTDGFEFEHKSGNSNQRLEFVSRRSFFTTDSDRLNSVNYDNLHGSRFDSDEIIRNHVRDRNLDRQALREREIRDSMIEIGPSSENVGGGSRGFSGKCEFYGSDSGIYGNTRGNRDNSYEYNRTPRKQVQKKSALLRIQKPCFRNRDNDELHYSGYYDEKKSGSFRGKDKVVCLDHGVRAEEEREGSPVELDVSFKSNSLVVNFGSSFVPDTNLTPKNGKNKKVMVSNNDCSSQQMNKIFDGSIKVNSSRNDVNNASDSYNKDSKQSGNEVAPPSTGEMHHHNLQSCTNHDNDSPAKIAVKRSKCIVPDKGGTDVGTNKTRVKVAKKKRVVKKLVKKVINPNVQVSSLQPTENLEEPVKADGSTFDAPAAPVLKMGVKPFQEKITAGMTSVHDVDFQPSANKVIMLPENEKVGGSSQAVMGSEEVNIDIDSGGSCITKVKRERSGSISSLASPIHKETKIDAGFVNADNSFGDLQNTDKDLTKSLNETTVSDISPGEVVGNNSATKASPNKLVSAGADINSDLISLEENKINKDPVNTYVFAHGMNKTTSFNNGLVSSWEKITSSDIGTMDTCGKKPCKNQDCSAVESFPMAILPGRSNEMSTFSSSEETGIHNVSLHVDCSNHDKGSISGFDNASINIEEVNLGHADCLGKQLSSDGVTISLESSASEGLSNTMLSGGREEDTPNITDKSKVVTCPSDLLGAMITDIYKGPAKAVSSAECMNTTLSVKDSSLAEVKVNGCFDSGLQSFPDGFSVFQESNSTGQCLEAKVTTNSGFIGTSPDNRKRRKVLACHPGIPSQMTSEISEGPVTVDLSTSSVGIPSQLNEGLIQPEGQVTVSNMDKGLSSVVAASVSRDVFGARDDDCPKIDQARAASCSLLEESYIPNATFSCPTLFGSEQTVNADPVVDGNNRSSEAMCMADSKAEKMNAVAAEKQVTMCNETTQLKTSSEYQSPNLIERLPGTVIESDGDLLESDDSPCVSTSLALAADGDVVSTTNSNDEIMELDTTLSGMGSPEILSGVPVIQSLICEQSTGQDSDEMVCGNEKMRNEKPVMESISNLSSHSSSSRYVKNNLKSDCMLESAHLVVGSTGPLPPQDVKFAAHNLNSKSGETFEKKNQLSHAALRNQSSRSNFIFNSTKNAASSTHITKPRTWHRTENSSTSSMPGNKSFLRAVPLQSHLPKKVAKFQSMSYIRKGNSLVRKPASSPVAALPQVSHGLTSSVYQLNSLGLGESKKPTGSDSRADVIDQPNFLRMGGINASFERPRTPPLPPVTKVPNRTTNSTGDCTSSPLSVPLPNCCSEATSDAQKLVEGNNVLNSSNDSLKVSEILLNQTCSVNNLEGQVELNDGALATSIVKKITYVKRKSNQLVAASNQDSSSVQSAEKTQGITSDGYYKRRRNQLIRTSLESHMNQTTNLPDTAISVGKKTLKDILGRSFSKRRSYKVVTKIHKPSRFSLVWTLKNMQSSMDNDHFSYPQNVLPSLFPWKRTAYWRRFVQNSVSISNNSSLSAISRKLLLLRKRDTVYTRSSHGFSLRKSKVLSVGGSSLKWSKSIEKRSKKANEEATLAVAAERKNREQNSAESFASETKSRSDSPRERIFRIGSVRYKMDSSRRTLQRISDDDESACSVALNSEKTTKKSYIPRRLVIGNDEYIRIGNGNQLIRDPKKRTRVLASEKVRWSLHTARLRLARKRKYCQFFTRFGKCNKDDGKCPYIHDPSKIAVCTKFLNGLCSNSNCKLTHKVIPERMPDCSYFLQGLCSNKDCPYRHVHVNPKTSTCEGFLKGYCADGNECRKKHSYVCPTFEATGSCPLGSKCKLHHPKSRSKGKKIRRSREQKNARGRYFGSLSIEDSKSRKIMSERHSVQDNGIICFEGKFADFISLDASDEEAGEPNDAINEQTTFHDSDASELQLADLDELIKPIRIMNII